MRDFRDCLSAAFVGSHAGQMDRPGSLTFLPDHIRRADAFKAQFMAAKHKNEARDVWLHTFDAVHADLIKLSGGFND